MYCSKCGTAIPENATFCTACGQPVNQPSALAPPNALPYGTAATPPLARPYGYVASPAFPGVAYAGFWLRVVAHLIDGILAGIAFVILLLIAFAMVGVDQSLGAGIEPRRIFYTRSYCDNFYAGSNLDRNDVALLCLDGEFFLSRNARKDGTRFNRHRPRGTTNLFRTCNRPLFCQDYYWICPARYRLRDGGLHGKEAGPSRYHCRLSGLKKSISFSSCCRLREISFRSGALYTPHP
jgi:hypothetical protein